MKKVIFMMCLAFGLSQTSNAQIQFGIKAGMNYNNNGDLTLSNVVNNAVTGAGTESGYHAGLWFRGKIPVIGVYLRPEIVYTQIKNNYVYKSSVTAYDFKKIDVPVLIGKKIFGIGNVFIGPSFQYVLGTDFGLSTVNEVSLDKFSVGMQSGFGLEIGRIGFDVRWERGLSSTEARFVDNSTNFNIDNRTNQIIVGLSYRL
jgi:hypothetical protein